MSKITRKYYFARLNILGSWSDKEAFIYKSLTKGNLETLRNFRYGIFDVHRITESNEKFVFGRLVKYKKILEGEIVDEEKREIVEGGLPLGVVASSEFILHYRSSILAYRPISNRLSHQQFRSVFSSLIEAANDEFFISAELKPIIEEYQMHEAIMKFSRIDRISYSIHPTNPSNRELYAHIDHRLDELNARYLKESIIAGEGGLNQEELENDDAYKSLQMASDGYGYGEVEGELDGHRTVISTEDSPVQEEVISTDDPENLVGQLFNAFRRLVNRGNDE